jgi:hypothetical protein
LLREIFAPNKILGGLEKLLREIFAPNKILGGLEKMKESKMATGLKWVKMKITKWK